MYGDLNMLKEFRFKVKSGVKFSFCTKIFTFFCEIFGEILMVKSYDVIFLLVAGLEPEYNE